MNPQLKNVQTAFDKVKEISERRKKLEAEQQELQAKIATLTAAVASGDTRSVNALAVAKARSESALPAELSAVQRDYDRAICALRDTLPPLSPMVAKAYGKERERMAAVAGEFLSGYLEDAYLVEVLTRQITENSKTVRALDFLNTRFSSGHITQPVGAAAVISRANNALAGLANVP
jgi:seryl-tRNA synthetase